MREPSAPKESKAWQSQDFWRLQAAQIALEKTIAKSRHVLMAAQLEWLEREFQELDRLSFRLARDAADLQGTSSPDSKRTRILADRLVQYYQRYGELERRIDGEQARENLALRNDRAGLRAKSVRTLRSASRRQFLKDGSRLTTEGRKKART